MLSDIPAGRERGALRSRFGMEEGTFLLTLLPGSRMPEIDRLLPAMLEACRRMASATGGRRIKLARVCASGDGVRGAVEEWVGRSGLDVTLIAQGAEGYDLFAASDLVLISSGTATLETASSAADDVQYRVSILTWLIARCYRLDCIAWPTSARKKSVPNHPFDAFRKRSPRRRKNT
jgi:lipid-A-disaccharide synthase